MAKVLAAAVETPSGKVVIVKRGEIGYRNIKAGDEWETMTVQEINALLGVTAEQAEKMMIGSMFGWDVPGAQGIDQ
jgi:hypothetical protein